MKAMIKSNKLYDACKYVVHIALPAIGALYFALSQTLHLPAGAEVVGTISIVDTFLASLLHLNSAAYNASDDKYDGTIDVDATDAKKTFNLNLHSDPDDLDSKKQVVFKVNPVKKTTAKKT